MVIVGGGSSTRFGSDKLMADVGGHPLVAVTVERIAPHVDRCVLVVRSDMVDRVAGLGLQVSVTAGGPTRTSSEMAGLEVVGDEFDLVGVHDAARPLVSANLIDSLFDLANEYGGAVPVVDSDELILERSTHSPVHDLKRAQTPQVFRTGPLFSAYAKAAKAGLEAHDTAEVVQHFEDILIAAVPGDPRNLKVTFPADLDTVREAVRT